jgi:hypothetical protein
MRLELVADRSADFGSPQMSAMGLGCVETYRSTDDKPMARFDLLIVHSVDWTRGRAQARIAAIRGATPKMAIIRFRL